MSAHPISPATLAVPGSDDAGAALILLLELQREAFSRKGVPSYHARIEGLESYKSNSDIAGRSPRRCRRIWATLAT
jgi:hypothetical protein